MQKDNEDDYYANYLEGIPLCCGKKMDYINDAQCFCCSECATWSTDSIIYQTDSCPVCFLVHTDAAYNGEPHYQVIFHDDETFSSFTHGIQWSDHSPCKGLAPYEEYLIKGHFSFDPKKMRTSVDSLAKVFQNDKEIENPFKNMGNTTI